MLNCSQLPSGGSDNYCRLENGTMGDDRPVASVSIADSLDVSGPCKRHGEGLQRVPGLNSIAHRMSQMGLNILAELIVF